ncbi:hypothetical protein B0H14DRAFT_3768137 [Mycena olivaceomarginata]|nr:hypothetical protein B0H14DRAFT_3768137 [Mycena olivaceomarginata]
MRDARGARLNAEKENKPITPASPAPLSPKSRAIQHHKSRADAAEAQNIHLKREHTKSARREKQHKKQINDLKKQIIAAKDELQEAISHGEAQVRGVLKRKADDKKGWQRRLGDAESRLAAMEQQTSKSTKELKAKLEALPQIRAALRLARRQSNRQNNLIKRIKNGSHTVKHRDATRYGGVAVLTSAMLKPALKSAGPKDRKNPLAHVTN